MLEHYDPLYARSRKRRDDQPFQVVELSGLSPDDVAGAAKAILENA